MSSGDDEPVTRKEFKMMQKAMQQMQKAMQQMQKAMQQMQQEIMSKIDSMNVIILRIYHFL